MKFSMKAFAVNQLTAKDFCTLCDAENIVRQVLDHYDKDIILENPNTGECISIDELPRVLGILDFLSTSRVVEVKAKN
jgi:hypothetical protein